MSQHATKIAPGVYHYRGCEIDAATHDNEDYVGWWALRDLADVLSEAEYYPTKRAAMAAIDQDPPAGF